MHRIMSVLILYMYSGTHTQLWLAVEPGGRQQLWAALSLISSELLEPTALCSASQAAGENKENGGWQEMLIFSTTKGEGEGFPTG